MMAEPEQRPVRIGLVGAGAIMRLSHGPTVSKSPDARLQESSIRMALVRKH